MFVCAVINDALEIIHVSCAHKKTSEVAVIARDEAFGIKTV